METIITAQEEWDATGCLASAPECQHREIAVWVVKCSASRYNIFKTWAVWAQIMEGEIKVELFFPQRRLSDTPYEFSDTPYELATPKNEPLLSSCGLLHIRDFKFLKHCSSIYQRLGYMWTSVQKWQPPEVHPALGWNKATIFQQSTVSLLIVQGNKKKKRAPGTQNVQDSSKWDDLTAKPPTTFSQRMPWDP